MCDPTEDYVRYRRWMEQERQLQTLNQSSETTVSRTMYEESQVQIRRLKEELEGEQLSRTEQMRLCEKLKEEFAEKSDSCKILMKELSEKQKIIDELCMQIHSDGCRIQDLQQTLGRTEKDLCELKKGYETTLEHLTSVMLEEARERERADALEVQLHERVELLGDDDLLDGTLSAMTVEGKFH